VYSALALGKVEIAWGGALGGVLDGFVERGGGMGGMLRWWGGVMVWWWGGGMVWRWGCSDRGWKRGEEEGFAWGCYAGS